MEWDGTGKIPSIFIPTQNSEENNLAFYVGIAEVTILAPPLHSSNTYEFCTTLTTISIEHGFQANPNRFGPSVLDLIIAHSDFAI
jgi:hypothetical protein